MKRATIGAGLALGASLGVTGTAHATDFTVDDLGDAGDGTCAPASCTLRDAIDDSNASNSVADRVLFQSSLTGTIHIGNPLTIIDEVQVVGPGPILDGENSQRLFDVDLDAPGEPVMISGLTLTAGNAIFDSGGAILNTDADLTISDSTLTSSYADFGGAISGQANLVDSTLSGNSAHYSGGAINSDDLTISGSLLTGNYAAGNVPSTNHGGAIYSSGSLEIDSTTVSDNYAGTNGGAIYLHSTSSPSVIRNTTISGNEAANRGGAIYDAGAGGPVTIESSTIAGNIASVAAGGISQGSGETLRNTIVADNSAPSNPDLRSSPDPFNVAFSLIENTSGGTLNQTVAGSNLLGVDPQLGALADNGGPTVTQAPAQTSPVVDKGSAFGATADQRGRPRPIDSSSIANSGAPGADGSDIGAVELQADELPPPTSPATSAALPKCKGKTATISARRGLARTFNGSNKRDVIVGTNKKDKIKAGGGNDLVCAKGGKDTVLGGGGKDKLYGQGGKDTLKGGAGKDKLVGGGAADKLLGGAGKDTCVGGAGKDTEKSC